MKHRSIAVCILIAMAFAVVPHAVRPLTTLLDAAGDISKAGVWNVILRYHA